MRLLSDFDKTLILGVWKHQSFPRLSISLPLSVCRSASLTHKVNFGQKQLLCGSRSETNNGLFQGAEIMV